MIFDTFYRLDDSSKKNRESYFEFYNRSSRPEINRVRLLLENCISRYPASEINELVARIRSRDNNHFKSATFELFLHEALLRKGFELQPHPELFNGSNSKPDFLVKASDGNEFYLEAVLATERNDIDEGGEARKNMVFDSLEQKPHKNFRVAIEAEGYPKSQPSSKKLQQAIHSWLDSLNPDEIQQQIDTEGFEAVTAFGWSHEDWHVIFRPIPLKVGRRGKSTTLIGIHDVGGGFVDAWSPIRDAIRFKGAKYGLIDKPLLVAINLNSFHLERIDEMQALYGQEQFFFQVGNPNAEPIMERAPNGAWRGIQGPQYTRVSGAWIFNDLHPTSIAMRNQTIYFNPWANNNLPNSLKSFPHAVLENNKMRWFEGSSFAEIFDLKAGWPE